MWKLKLYAVGENILGGNERTVIETGEKKRNSLASVVVDEDFGFSNFLQCG